MCAQHVATNGYAQGKWSKKDMKKWAKFRSLEKKHLTLQWLIMRKSTNIILSAILSLMIVWIGSGIMTVVCEHTGNVSVAHQSSKRHCNDANADHCMRLQIKTLSPTDMAPTGFHHLQPVLLSLLPQLVTHYDLLPLPVCARASWRMSHPLVHGTKRQYLRLLTTLLIWFRCFPLLQI